MNQIEELRKRIGKINIGNAITEYMIRHTGNATATYNPCAFDERNIYNTDCIYWKSVNVKKPSLLELEECYVIFLEKQRKLEIAKCYKELREKRTEYLKETDWTQYADVPMKKESRSRYRDYRKYLRDAPSRYDNKSVPTYHIEEFGEWLLRVHPEDFDA